MDLSGDSDSQDLCRGLTPLDQWMHWSLLPSVAIVVILSFFQKGNPFLRQICRGRPGILPPANLLDSYSNRWTYGIAFGATTSTVAALAMITLFGSKVYSSSYLGIVNVPSWAKVFLVVVAILEIGVNFFPFFACLSTPYRFIGSLLGFFYASFWLGVQLHGAVICFESIPSFQNQKVVIFMTIATSLPTIFCLLCLWCRFAYLFVKSSINYVRWYRQKNMPDIPKIMKHNLLDNHHIYYVKRLLLGTKISSIQEEAEKKLTRFQKFVYVSLYKPDPFFKFSSRIIVTFVVLTIVWYQFALLFIWFGAELIQNFKTQQEESSFLFEFFDVAEKTWYVAAPITCIIEILFILHMLTCYREHTLRLYRGEKKHMPPCKPSPEECMVEGLRYSGVQIAHFIWSVLFIQVELCIVFIAVAYVFIIPFINHQRPTILITVIPFILVIGCIHVLQIVLAKYAFLQRYSDNKKRILALKNRKLYHLVSYFMFFFDIALGVVACLIRLSVSLFLGILFVGRLDRTIIMRGYQKYDKGFMNYVCMLYVENAHCHPVLVSFCQLLIQSQHQKQGCRSCTAQLGRWSHQDDEEEEERDEGEKRVEFLRARARWQLAYSLLRNPGLRNLVPIRRPESRPERPNEPDNAETTIEMSENLSVDFVQPQIRAGREEVSFQHSFWPCCFKSASPDSLEVGLIEI